jgi:putative nucleotidyltransferase with HDIG domain
MVISTTAFSQTVNADGSNSKPDENVKAHAHRTHRSNSSTLSCMQVVKQAPCRLRVRWAALLHDVGKPATVSVDTERKKLIFHAHENVGALMVDRILSR